MEYTIVEDPDADYLVNEVNQRISEGWHPLGGVACSVRHNDHDSEVLVWYAQAMLRPTVEPSKEAK